LLLHNLAAVGQPLAGRAGFGQLRCLRAVSRRGPAAGIPPRLLLDGQVPYEPGVCAVTGQDGPLRWRRY
jgi:hypothetical protein